MGFWSTSSVRRHIRTPWAVARTGGRVISRVDGGYEVFGRGLSEYGDCGYARGRPAGAGHRHHPEMLLRYGKLPPLSAR